MILTIILLFIYVTTIGLSAVMILIFLNIPFALSFFSRNSDIKTDRCWPCVREYVSRKRLPLIFWQIPTGICVIFLLLLFIWSFAITYKIQENITESTRLIIRSGGNCHRTPEREHVLFETIDHEVIKKFAKQISLEFNVIGSSCRCCGEITFDLYQGQEKHYSFSLHHGNSIRIKGTVFGDNELSFSSRQKLKKWLDQVGVTKALKEIKEQKEQKEQKIKVNFDAMDKSTQPKNTIDGLQTPQIEGRSI